VARPPGQDVLRRFEGNPILSQRDVPYRTNTVFNGTPARVDGVYWMLFRVEGQQGYSFFALARSEDGLHFEVEPHPCMMPADSGPWHMWESDGIEDPRLTRIEGEFYVLYTAVGPHGPRIALARTEDFHRYERIAMISGPGNKDGVLFPERINGLYARLDRPIGKDVGSVWLSWSPDRVHWGRSRPVFRPRPGFWDSYRVGASAAPIRTDRGWLEIYHGIKMTPGGPIYSIGTILLDAADPSRVLGRCIGPVLSPQEPYERIGDVNNVVFACGVIVEDDDSVKVYYGAADTSICVATGRLPDLIACSLEGSGEP